MQFDGTYVKLELAAQSIPSFDSFQQADNSTDAIYRASTAPNNTISSKEDLQNILVKLQGSPQGKQTSGKKFNVALFIVLFFAFWPIAFIYAASYYMKSQKKTVLLKKD